MIDHYHQQIQGWFQCESLYRAMVHNAKNGAIFVEVGVWKGKSAAFMAVEIINSGKKIEFYAVDHFEGSPEHKNNKIVINNKLKDECYKNLNPVRDVVQILPITSLEAAKIFKNQSINFVYIDGSHEYDDVMADILAWGPKVKPGGIIAGDDYGNGIHPDVKKVVDKMFPLAKKHGLVWFYEKQR